MTRTELIAALEVTRKTRVCGYVGNRCDCKYGIKELPDRRMHVGGEQTGCPEMRVAIEVLEAMTDEQFHELTKL